MTYSYIKSVKNKMTDTPNCYMGTTLAPLTDFVKYAFL